VTIAGAGTAQEAIETDMAAVLTEPQQVVTRVVRAYRQDPLAGS